MERKSTQCSVHLSVFYGNKTDKIDLQNVPGIIYDCVEFSVVFLINNPHHIFCKGNVSDGIYLISVSTQSTSWECLTFTITALDPISHLVHMYSLQRFFIPKTSSTLFYQFIKKKIRVHFDFNKTHFVSILKFYLIKFALLSLKIKVFNNQITKKG